jgi:hypothetical protein
MTATLSVDELLVEFVSPAVTTLAVLPIFPDADELTATTSGIGAEDAAAVRGPGLVHVTTCELAPQVQPELVADTNVN